jgi:osmotically-inducible protein OsmY
MGHRIRTFAAGAAVGAGIAYLYDPRSGAARRSKLIDMASARARRATRELEREARYRQGQLEGLQYRADHPEPEQGVYVDDQTLKDRVESEVFGEALPKGSVVVTVVDSVVELRGQLQHPEDIRELAMRVSRVPGVVDVKSYLHLPNTPAPNKRDAREAS